MSRIPGFNRFQLCLADWQEACEAYGIRVLQIPLRRAHGCSMYKGSTPYIIINSQLRGADKVIALGHEFTHIVDQEIPDQAVLLSTGCLYNLSKAEKQAQVIGVVSLMPEPLVHGLRAEDLMRVFGVSRTIAEFRTSLHI